MKYMNMKAHARQAGFTLLELVIAITLIGIIAAVLYPKLNVNKSRGTILYATMNEAGKALLSFKNDTSCYPSKLAALYDKDQADQSFCGIDLRENWKQPYVQKTEFDSSGNMKVSQVVTGATLSIVVEDTDIGQAWIVRASGIPNEILSEALTSCNGNKTATGRCTATPGSGTGTLDYVFDENT